MVGKMRAVLALLVIPLINAAIPIDTCPEIPELAIKWVPYTPKYTTCKLVPPHSFLFLVPSHVKAEEAFIEVPQDCFGEYVTKTKRLRMRVRRLFRGEPKHHLWIIPGGPGGHANAVEGHYDYYANFIPEDVWFYFMDHRGTGKSGK